MNAGLLNRRITIQTKTSAPDSSGQMIDSWSNLFGMWTQVLTSGGKEFYAAQKLRSDVTAVFKVRYTRGISVQQRINYEGRIFEILSANDPDGMRRELHISAKEVV